MTLRTAVSTRRWENTGELSTHYWIEVEPELWMEVDDLGTAEAREQFRTEHPPVDKPVPGKTYALRAHTRFLHQFSDTLKFQEQP